MSINVGNRKAAGTIKQTEAKGFEKVGDAYAGTFRGVKTATITDKDGTREASLILLDPDTGDRFGVWSNKVLDDMMTDVPVGTFIVIKHTAVGKAKGKRQGAKLFEVTKYE